MQKLSRLSVLVKPSSSACNLGCSYCFYIAESAKRKIEDYGKMEFDTWLCVMNYIFSATTDNAQISICFQGGEPTLIGIDFYRRALKLLDTYRGNRRIFYAMQTNGTLLNDLWINLFKEYHFLLGISIDGIPSIHDENRFDASKVGSYQRAIRGYHLAKKAGLDINVLTVVTDPLVQNVDAFIQWLIDEEIEYVQCIPCIDEDHRLTPQYFASFIKRLFHAKKIGLHTRIGNIEEIMQFLLERTSAICGIAGLCAMQSVIEADGSIFPCDFYAIDQYCLGNVHRHSFEDIINHPSLEKFLADKDVPNMCKSCRYWSFCNGYCKFERQACISDNYCSHAELLEFVLKTGTFMEV